MAAQVQVIDPLWRGRGCGGRGPADRGEPRIGIGYWLNPWWRETHVLDSQHSPDACMHMLRDKTGVLWGKPFLRLVGFPTQDRLAIYRRPRVRTGNSFRIFAYVSTNPGGRGTKIDVALRSNFLLAGFITFWLGVVILVNLMVLIHAINAGSGFEELLYTVPFPVFGFGLLSLGRRMSRNDGPALLDFIRQTTDAQDLPTI